MASFELLMGPLLVLVCFALILFGIFTAQVYFYWNTYEKDSRFVRNFVLALWILEALHTTFCICMLYTYFINHFGDANEVEVIVWSAVATVFLEIIIVSLTQAFYIYRIWKLSKRNFLVASIPALALLARVVLGYVAAGFLVSYKTWTAFREERGPQLTLNVALSCGGFVDLVTTGLLSYFLWRSRTSFPRTRHVVDRLLHFALNTGALTMIFSMAILFTYNLVTTSLLWAGMVEIVSKLYANSMLAMLNARNNIRNASASAQHDTSGSGPLDIRMSRRTTRGLASEAVRVDVFKETVTVTDFDRADAQDADAHGAPEPAKDPAAFAFALRRTGSDV
ncbi:hypothetical protein PsYK624_064890 [Phanerochaete sordida]|uniref:DUF6534 domain-containing protein n=1 Tax=Phanerochaete sordida TaxID=48140 RepID=A0A9P3LDH5_9APHY|nr:hypothetical protein PsYK624_064890 [Phanerochaete sordida]